MATDARLNAAQLKQLLIDIELEPRLAEDAAGWMILNKYDKVSLLDMDEWDQSEKDKFINATKIVGGDMTRIKKFARSKAKDEKEKRKDTAGGSLSSGGTGTGVAVEKEKEKKDKGKGKIEDKDAEVKSSSFAQEEIMSLQDFLQILKAHEQRAELEESWKRLRQRLELFGLSERHTSALGDCQFDAIADQLRLQGMIISSLGVRQAVVAWLEKNPTFLVAGAPITSFVNDKTFAKYCEHMKGPTAWGDHLTLVAAANVYCVEIDIWSSVKSNTNFIVEIKPTSLAKRSPLLLAHVSELHFISLGIAPKDGLSSSDGTALEKLVKTVDTLAKEVRALKAKDYDSISQIGTERSTTILTQFGLIGSKKIETTLNAMEDEFEWDTRTEVQQHPDCLKFIEEKILNEKEKSKSTSARRWIIVNRNNTEFDSTHSIKGVVGDIREDVTPFRIVFEIKPPHKILSPDSERQAALTLVLALYSNKHDKLANTTTSTMTTSTTEELKEENAVVTDTPSDTPIIVLTDLKTSCWIFCFNDTATITKTPIESWQQLAQMLKGGGDKDKSKDDKSGKNIGGGRGGSGSKRGNDKDKETELDNSSKRRKQSNSDNTQQSKRALFVTEFDLDTVIEQTLSLPMEDQKEYIYSVCLSYM